MVFGIIKPSIILPDIELTEQEWRYILSHEVYHYYHGDLLVKFACEVLHALYWWNPIITILKNRISDLFEVTIDIKVTEEMDELKKIDYLHCLIAVAKLRKMKYIKKRRLFVAFTSKSAYLTISDRIDFILNDVESKKRYFSGGFFITLFLIFTIVFLPSLFIMEPYGLPDEIEEETFDINEENIYAVMNSDGTYSLYLNHVYQGTIESIFDENIPIYQTTQEE